MSAFSPEEQKLLVQAEYGQFLREKIKLAQKKGFDVPLEQIHSGLKPHTRDIVRWALAGGQAARAVENHVCPFQIDIVDRLINRYTNPGEKVYDPFCGLGTVPVRAMKLGRTGGGSELNATYFRDQVHYCQSMEREISTPTLFDLVALDQENAS